MQLLGLRQTRPAAVVAVQRGLLVRVLAVAQHRGALPRRADPRGQLLRRGSSGASVDPIQVATATSYSAVCRKANDASIFRSASVNPPARTAASTPS